MSHQSPDDLDAVLLLSTVADVLVSKPEPTKSSAHDDRLAAERQVAAERSAATRDLTDDEVFARAMRNV